MFEGFMLAIHIFGFCAVLVVMWVMGDKSPSKEVWTHFSDHSGWGSYGVATLVGSLGASGALLGSDSAAHLAEELKDAAWVLPRSMVATAAVNYTLTLVVVVYVFRAGLKFSADVDEVQPKHENSHDGGSDCKANANSSCEGLLIDWPAKGVVAGRVWYIQRRHSDRADVGLSERWLKDIQLFV